MQKNTTKNTTKNINKKIKGSSFITNIKEIETNPGYYSVNNLYSMNAAEDMTLPILSELLGKGNYYVPSYLSLYGKHKEKEEDTLSNDEEEEEEEEDKENIIITITPIEKCNDKVIDTAIYNQLVDSAEGKKQQQSLDTTKKSKSKMNKQTKKRKNIKNIKNRKTKRI